MARRKLKQITGIFTAFVGVSTFAATAANNNTVTASITTALSTAGRGGTSVPLQISGTVDTKGVVTTSTKNRVEIYKTSDGSKLADLAGNEVYGRLTEAAGAYTLSYFTNVAGVETAFVMTAGNIDFEFEYRFEISELPEDFAVGIKSRRVKDDVAGGSGAPYSEILTPTALNTLPALAKTPIGISTLKLFVNGDVLNSQLGEFTLAAKTITLVPASVGYPIDTTDAVVAYYHTFE
jgi:hypothetical protein